MDAFHERTDDYNQFREKNQVWRWNFCKFCCIVLLFAPIRGANTHKKDTITVDDIDALTGATITSKAVADAVANAINVVESLG